MKKIFLSSDHAGYKLKEFIKLHLDKKKIKYTDLGPFNVDKVDYPDYAHKVAKKVKINKKDTAQNLSKKILKQEHILYPKAILKLFSNF